MSWCDPSIAKVRQEDTRKTPVLLAHYRVVVKKSCKIPVKMTPRGNLFGTTQSGGANGDGTVFELAAGSGTITTLASFNGTNGANPETGLVRDPRGNLFG